jgi:spore coat polysaccharide biosynthesis predicted glycosyltransferase SpsG
MMAASAGVCFHVDASNIIGLGHLMESVILARILERNGCRVSFIMRAHPEATGPLKEKGYEVRAIGKDASDEEEIKAVQGFVRDAGIDVLVCNLRDRYADFFRKLRVDAALVAVQDNDRMEGINADVVVNFSIMQDGEFYRSLPDSGKYAIGPMYAVLPEEMHSRWKEARDAKKACSTIFVNQGGSDPFGLTAKTIRALELLELKERVIVVVGPAISEKHRKELEAMIEGGLKNDYHFEWGVPQRRLHDIMRESDIALTAAGDTLYELSVFGVPSIIICHHETHNRIANRFSEVGAAINLGVGSDVSEQVIADTLKGLLGDRERRALLSRNARSILDGRGSERVSDIIMKAIEGRQI